MTRVSLCLCALAAAVPAWGGQEDLCRPVTSDWEATTTPETGTEAPTRDTSISIDAGTADVGREGAMRFGGGVTVTQGNRQIRAENVEVDAEGRNFRVEGKVDYRDDLVRVQGESGSYDAMSGAKIGGAEFELPLRPARGQAREISVRPDGQVVLDDVEYTTCPVGSRDWTLSASGITLDTARRNGTGNNVRLDFKGVPILYTPIISFPLGNERKTGFLFPDFSYSKRSGVELAVPYYFNLAPQYDLMLTPRWYSTRGINLDTDFRYLGRRTEGSVLASYLPYDDETAEDRSFVRWQHRSDFGRNWRFIIDAANASDDDYFEDFGLGANATSVQYVERVAEMRYYSRHWTLLAQLQNFQTIDETIPEPGRPYSRVPRFLARGQRENGPLGLTYRFEGELVNFTREEGIVGARFDAQPEILLPLRGAGYYFEPAAAYRYTRYELDHVPDEVASPHRGAPVFSLDTGLLFERPYGEDGKRVQTLEPRLLYLYVPFRRQDDLPVFDTGLPDLNLVQLFRRNRFIGADRLSDANQLSYGVTSRVLDIDSGQQLLTATLGQTVYFESPRVTLPGQVASDRTSSNIIAQLALTTYKDWNVSFGYEWDPEETRGIKSEWGVQYRPAPDSVINVGYRHRRDLIEQVDASVAWPIAQRWNVYSGATYSLRDEALIDQFAGFEYSSCCYRVRLVHRRYVSSRTGERDSSFALQLELKGLSSVGMPADAFLESSIRGYSRDPEGRPTEP